MSDAIVITGAAGFIGSHLARTLLERNPNARIIGIDNFDHFYSREMKLANIADLNTNGHRTGRGEGSDAPGRFSLIEADIRKAAAMSDFFAEHKPRIVYHLAALAGVRPSIADPARYVSVNLDGTINLLEAARHAGCRDFIFASSSSVYGNNTKVPFSEIDPVNEPISPYAATKASGELICHTYAHLFGLRIAALRFFTVFGPAQRPDLAIAAFMRKIANGEEIQMFGDGTTSRDYTYIDDIIKGVIAAGQRLSEPSADSPFFRIYNLGSDTPVTLRDMIGAIEEVVARNAIVKPMPMQPGDVDRTWADLTRSKAELNYQPQTPFIEGVRKQWEWLQRHVAPGQ